MKIIFDSFIILVFFENIVSYLGPVMRQSVQRTPIKDIVPVKWPLWILAERIPLVAHLERLLAAVRVRAKSSTANRVSANLPTIFLYCK